MLELLESRDLATVAKLAHTFAVSAVTVRNDLAVLAASVSRGAVGGGLPVARR